MPKRAVNTKKFPMTAARNMMPKRDSLTTVIANGSGTNFLGRIAELAVEFKELFIAVESLNPTLIDLSGFPLLSDVRR